MQGFHSLINRYKGRGTSASGLMDGKPLSDITGENNMPDTIRISQFLDDEGRVIQLPKKQTARRAVLAYLAGKFDLDTDYTEKQVNVLCNSWHIFGDPCFIRRELVDNGLLDRENDCSRYWRVAEENNTIETNAGVDGAQGADGGSI